MQPLSFLDLFPELQRLIAIDFTDVATRFMLFRTCRLLYYGDGFPSATPCQAKDRIEPLEFAQCINRMCYGTPGFLTYQRAVIVFRNASFAGAVMVDMRRIGRYESMEALYRLMEFSLMPPASLDAKRLEYRARTHGNMDDWFAYALFAPYESVCTPCRALKYRHRYPTSAFDQLHAGRFLSALVLRPDADKIFTSDDWRSTIRPEFRYDECRRVLTYALLSGRAHLMPCMFDMEFIGWVLEQHKTNAYAIAEHDRSGRSTVWLRQNFPITGDPMESKRALVKYDCINAMNQVAFALNDECYLNIRRPSWAWT